MAAWPLAGTGIFLSDRCCSLAMSGPILESGSLGALEGGTLVGASRSSLSFLRVGTISSSSPFIAVRLLTVESVWPRFKG